MSYGLVSLVLVVLALSGCAAVEGSSETQQKMGKELYAGKGDIVIRIDHEKNLPNIFGKSDIFGRKTATGLTTLQYLGTKKGNLVFLKSGVLLETNESTLSQTGMLVPTQNSTSMSGMVGDIPVSATSVSQSSTYIPPAEVRGFAKSVGDTKIYLNPKKEKFLAIEGYVIQIIDSSENNLIYKIEKQ